MNPLHYCPHCGADSRYAPQPATFPKWQEYQCGALTIYTENGERNTIRCGMRKRAYFPPSTKSQAGF